MDFALNDDHIMLRNSAESFVSKETSIEALLVPGATVADANYEKNWQKIIELGWHCLVIPEDNGGVGLDCVELMVVLNELGKTLMPNPLLGHTLGCWAAIAASGPQGNNLLESGASGECTLGYVAPGEGNQVTATQTSTGWTLQGQHLYVVDALSAQQLIVAAATENGGQYFVVEASQSGVDIQLQPWRDITRQMCKVSFDAASVEPLAGDFDEIRQFVRDRACFALSAENVGGLRTVLKSTVDYANERVAFGRPIGSFQAIKHPLAEMLGETESAAAAVLYAAWALSKKDDRASLAASMAKSHSSDAYVAAVHKSIQVFGAIGFTWEMKNHLYFKRAYGNAEMFGNARQHRDHVVNIATQREWTNPFASEDLQYVG